MSRDRMERKRYILVDSSTKQKGSGWGQSVACWAVYNSLDAVPIQVGLVYYPNWGPNLTFLAGVINGLRYCADDHYMKYTLSVLGDCEPVINILTEKWNAHVLAELRDEAWGFEEWLSEHRLVSVQYGYVNVTTLLAYRYVDQCAKDAANFICQRFKLK